MPFFIGVYSKYYITLGFHFPSSDISVLYHTSLREDNMQLFISLLYSKPEFHKTLLHESTTLHTRCSLLRRTRVTSVSLAEMTKAQQFKRLLTSQKA